MCKYVHSDLAYSIPGTYTEKFTCRLIMGHIWGCSPQCYLWKERIWAICLPIPKGVGIQRWWDTLNQLETIMVTQWTIKTMLSEKSKKNKTQACCHQGSKQKHITYFISVSFKLKHTGCGVEGGREWDRGMLIKGENKDAHYLHHTVDSVVVGRIINSALCT